MREKTVSNCEKAFLLKAILEGKRLDGRKANEHRKLNIIFANTYGCCMVSLGETRVMAQTTYEVQIPKQTRPNEGLLLINVELSSMAAQHFEPGRPSDESVQINRLLEKCIKESKCVDLESLCIVAEEKVWAIRVDVTVLNHDGGLVDCASIAALASLAHSRRPDFTMSGEEVTIHTFAERDPLPLTLHHHPICVSYAIFNNGEKAVVDPTLSEEESAETRLVVGMNAYRELCGLHLDGLGLPFHYERDIVLQCVDRTAAKATDLINTLKQTLAEDANKRQNKEKVGQSETVRLSKVSSLAEERIPVRINDEDIRDEARKIIKHKFKNKRKIWDEDGNEREEVDESDDGEVNDLGDNTAELANGNERKPRRIHIDLGQIDQENGASSAAANGDTEEEEEEDEDDDEEEEEDTAEGATDEESAGESSVESKTNKTVLIDETIEIDGSSSDDEVAEEKNPVQAKQGVKQKGDAKPNVKKDGRAKAKKVVEVEEASDDSDEVEVVKELTYEDKLNMAEKIVLDDSEEEETTILPGNVETSKQSNAARQKERKDASTKRAKKDNGKKARFWYPKDSFGRKK